MTLDVKICGLSTRETLEAALSAGADMVGFVFFEPSPRHVGFDLARELGKIAEGRALKVALFVDADDATIERAINALKPGLLQLHGRESVARVSEIKQKFGLPVAKAVPVETSADLGLLSDYAAVADRILFDARAPKGATRPGGLGVPFDWHLLDNVNLDHPFMLSGGLNAANVAEAIRFTRAGCIDVSSGVERAPGLKDAGMIRAFIRAAREADHTRKSAKIASRA